MATAVASVDVSSPAPTGATTRRSSRWVWLVAAAFVPLLVSYYWRLWELPHYQFFPLALAGAYWLARRDRPVAASSTAPVDRRAAGPLLFVGLLAVTAAVALDSPWLALPAALLVGGGCAVDRGGAAELRRLVPAALMVLITLRPPMGFDDRLIKLLQQLTARSASIVLDFFGVVHALSGNVIEIPGRRLLVEEACSGVNSFFSATACVLFYVLWNRRGWIGSLLLFLSIPFWVVFANTLRVVAVAVLRYRWNIAADEGRLHDALGIAVFLLAVGMIISTERLLRFYGEILERDVTAPPAAPVAPTISSPSSDSERKWRIAGVAAALLLLLQAPAAFGRLSGVATEWRMPPLAEFGEALVPERLGSWRRMKYETVERDRNSPLGRQSQVWSLAAADTKGVLSLDYPFAGWHELAECYEAQGWRIERRGVLTDPKGSSAPFVEVVFRQDQTGRYGLLEFALVTPGGEPYEVRTRGEFDEWRDRAAQRFRDLLHFRLTTDATLPADRTTYQVQFFADSYAPISDEQAVAARQAFLAFRRLTTDRLKTAAATQ